MSIIEYIQIPTGKKRKVIQLNVENSQILSKETFCLSEETFCHPLVQEILLSFTIKKLTSSLSANDYKLQDQQQNRCILNQKELHFAYGICLVAEISQTLRCKTAVIHKS